MITVIIMPIYGSLVKDSRGIPTTILVATWPKTSLGEFGSSENVSITNNHDLSKLRVETFRNVSKVYIIYVYNYNISKFDYVRDGSVRSCSNYRNRRRKTIFG